MGILGAGLLCAFIALRVREPPPLPQGELLSTAKESERVLARVGPREIAAGDLLRYRTVRQLTVGEVSERQALDELCDRALLELAAQEAKIAAGEAEILQQMLRMRLMIAAALPAPPWGAPSMLGRAGRKLWQSAISPEDLEKEAAADALAAKVRQELVYQRVRLSRAEVLRAWAPGAGAARKPDAAALQVLEARLRRERGAPRLSALLAQARVKWPVERSAATQGSGAPAAVTQ